MNRKFWNVALDRAVRSAAQAALLVLGADQVPTLDAFAVDWQTVASFGVGGFVLSLLTSLAFTPPEAQP